MKIYLVRHGICDSNVKRVFNYLDEDLNDEGINQIKCLSNEVNKLDFDVIYSSTLLRCRHTTDILNINNKEVIYDKRLNERHPGSFEGKPFDLVDREKYWNYYNYEKIQNEETIKELFKRVEEFLDELKNKKYDTVVIVSHSGVSKAFFAYFEGIPKDGSFLNSGIKNGEIKIYNI